MRQRVGRHGPRPGPHPLPPAVMLVAGRVARQQARGCGHQVTHATLQRHAPLDDGGPDMTDIARGQGNQRHAVAKTQRHRRVGRTHCWPAGSSSAMGTGRAASRASRVCSRCFMRGILQRMLHCVNTGPADSATVLHRAFSRAGSPH